MTARPFIEADWPAPSGVHALTTLRHGAGVSKPPFDTFNMGLRNGDALADALENRRQLGGLLGLPSAPRWLRQVHGTRAMYFDEASVAGDEPEADAAVTDTRGVVLAILTADCLPVVFAARAGSEVAAAHAGWRGLAAGVLEVTLSAMKTAPRDVIAWLGPAAGPQAYEIGAEVRDAFVGGDADAEAAFTATRPGHWKVDLYALARRRLAAAGMAPADIHGGDRCTIREADAFFSHRRDGIGGRIATLAWLA